MFLSIEPQQLTFTEHSQSPALLLLSSGSHNPLYQSYWVRMAFSPIVEMGTWRLAQDHTGKKRCINQKSP